MNHHQGSIYCIDWSRTGRLIATGSNDKTIKLLVCPDFQHDQNSDLLELMLEGHQAIVRSVCFNPANDLNLLSGGHMDPDVKIWDSETGQSVHNLQGHQGSINSVKMANDGSFAISVGTDKTIRMWDIRDSRQVNQLDASDFSEMNEICFAKSNLHNGNIMASIAHKCGEISFWDLTAMRPVHRIQNFHQSECRSLSLTEDCKFLATAGFDGMVKIMDLETMSTVKELQEHSDKVVSVKWHPYLPMLLSTSADKSARVWLPS
jgi:WD40 repeat protein